MRPGQRPLRLKSGDELKALLQGALVDADGVTGAHCIHERWMRGDFAAHIETDLELLGKSAGPSIPDWLPMRYVSCLPAAYEVATADAPDEVSRCVCSPQPGRINIQHYALGWRNSETKVRNGTQTTRELHHHGTALGSISHFSVYPEEGVAILRDGKLWERGAGRQGGPGGRIVCPTPLLL